MGSVWVETDIGTVVDIAGCWVGLSGGSVMCIPNAQAENMTTLYRPEPSDDANMVSERLDMSLGLLKDRIMHGATAIWFEEFNPEVNAVTGRKKEMTDE